MTTLHRSIALTLAVALAFVVTLLIVGITIDVQLHGWGVFLAPTLI